MGANFLTIELDPNIFILAIYRSPSTRCTDSFLGSIENILRPISSKFKNVILAGDININITHDNTDRNSESYLNLLAELGMLPGHLYATRLNNCLDHIILKTIFPASVYVIDSTITDHSGVILNMDVTQSKSNTVIISKKIDFQGCVKYLESADFSYITPSSDANEVASRFVDQLTTAILTNSSTSHIPNRKRIIKPWLTSGLLRCIRNRDKLHKNLIKNPDNSIIEITYKRYRNFCNSLLRRLKRQYEKSLLQNAKTNKDSWNAIKTIIHYKKPKTTSEDLLPSTDKVGQEIERIN